MWYILMIYTIWERVSMKKHIYCNVLKSVFLNACILEIILFRCLLTIVKESEKGNERAINVFQYVSIFLSECLSFRDNLSTCLSNRGRKWEIEQMSIASFSVRLSLYFSECLNFEIILYTCLLLRVKESKKGN